MRYKDYENLYDEIVEQGMNQNIPWKRVQELLDELDVLYDRASRYRLKIILSRSVVFITVFYFCFWLLGCSAGTWRLKEENDYFTFFNQDNDYTQGLLLQNEINGRTFSVGQRVYTPYHKRVDPPYPNERPYAGYLFAGMQKEKQISSNQSFNYGLEGVVGPGALGKEAQCGIHALLGQDCPVGWHTQLSNEPALTGRVEFVNKEPVKFLSLGGLNEFKAMLEAGNVSTAAELRSNVKWQYGKLFYYAGPALRLVAYDAFLDRSSTIQKKWHVEEMRGGIGRDFGSWVLSWFIAVRSPQFDSQNSSYNYGGIEIEWKN